MKFLILCGGSGTRLFPVSRKKFPKQFIRIFDDKSLFLHTFERVLTVGNIKDIHVSTYKEYKFLVLDQLKEFPIDEDNIILEPIKKDTAPAIALSVRNMIEKGVDENEVVWVLPSDHFLKPEDAFKRYVDLIESVGKEGYILTFGIKPHRPATGYGYIETGAKINDRVYKVNKFHEKPDIETAKKYFLDEKFFWNSGMFAFSIKTFKEELKKFQPEMYEIIFEMSYEKMLDNFDRIKGISIDYAIMEKTDKAAVVPVDFVWSDVGSWDSVFEILPKKENDTVFNEKVINVDSKNTMLLNKDETNSRLIVGVGLEDIIVVGTKDVTLVVKKGMSQKIKDVVKIIESNKELSKFAETSPIEYRPWGYFIDLEVGNRYRIKRICVKPGASLSLQMHYHRSEHWIVVKGTAKVVIEDEQGNTEEYFVHENESTYVPKTTKHRLENPGKVDLELIEVQIGEYIGEDDIVRYKDIYGRA